MLLLIALLAGAAPARGQLALEVNACLGRAVERIVAAQRADGSFGPLDANVGATAGYPVGTTALALYALRKSGLRPDHAAVSRALQYLADKPFEKTYSVASLVLALDAHREPGHEQTILAAAAWLEENHDARSGLWAYPYGEAELSNTQLAVLALQAAARYGCETPPRLWAAVVTGALRRQRSDGGFYYRDTYWPEVSGTMTTAGLTTLYVALSFLEASGRHPAEQKLAREAIERGWAWLDARFSATGGSMGHAGLLSDSYPAFGRSDHQHYYFLYGIERVASFAGRREVGGVAWYPAIALEMLGAESPQGGWGSLENTCLAMLALRRVTASGGTSPPDVAPESAADVAAAAGSASKGRGAGSGVGDLQDAVAAAAAGAGRGAAAADDTPVTWAYTTDEPGKRWIEPGFDDSRWARGEGGFAGGGAAGLVARTTWETTDLWVRRTFRWSPRQGELRLFAIHDDALTVWINGEQAVSAPLWSQAKYVEYAIDRAALRSLRRGDNVIAARVHDTGGGQSLDIRFTPPDGVHGRGVHWTASLPADDVPFVRRWELLGPVPDDDHEALLEVELPDDLVDGGKFKGRSWQPARSLGARLPVDEAVGGRPETVTYASVWLHCPAPTEAYLWLGAADGVRAWLDGRPLLVHHEHGSARPDELRVPVSLAAGAQRLVLLLEQRGEECPLFARVAALDGQAVPGLVTSLTDETPDDPTVALAQPEAFDLATLASRLPVASATALRFAGADDVDVLAFDGVGLDDPRWIARVTDKLAGPRPAGKPTGVVSLWPPSAERPARLLVRLVLPARAPSLAATVALATDAEAAGRLRLQVFDGSLTTLVETDIAPETPRVRGGSQRVKADLAAYAGRDVLLILEWSALPGASPEPLFVDELLVR